MTGEAPHASPALRAVALGALGMALLAVATQTAWEGRSRLTAHAADAAERRIATTAAAMAGALGGVASQRTSPAAVARAAGAGQDLAEVRLGRPDEEEGFWEVASDDRGGPWHAPLPGRRAEPSHAAAWGSAVVGQIGLAGGPAARWAYARPGGAAATLLVGVAASPDWREAPARGPWLGLLLTGLASAIAGAWLAAARLGQRATAVEELRAAGLAAAVGRDTPLPPDAPSRLTALTAGLRDALGAALVAGAGSDARLEAHRRRRELVRALGWQAGRDAVSPDASFAAGWPRLGTEQSEASGWVRRDGGALAWLAEASAAPLTAAARQAALAVVAERALATHAGWPALREALRPLLATEAAGFMWAAPDGHIRVLGRAPREVIVFGADGARRALALAAEDETALAPGETLVLASGGSALLASLLAQLEALVQLPHADAAQLVALLEGAAGELAAGQGEAIGLVVAVAVPVRPRRDEPTQAGAA